MQNTVPEEVRQRAAQKAAYVKNLLRFAVGLVVLLAINLLTSPGYLWVMWVALFGAIGFGVKGVKLFGGLDRIEGNLQSHFEKKEMDKRDQ